MNALKKRALLGFALMERAKKREAAIVDKAMGESRLTSEWSITAYTINHYGHRQIACRWASVFPPYNVRNGKELVAQAVVVHQVCGDFRIRAVKVSNGEEYMEIYLPVSRAAIPTPVPAATRQSLASLNLELLKHAKKREAAAVDWAAARLPRDQSLQYCGVEFTRGSRRRRGFADLPCHSGSELVEHLVAKYHIQSDFHVNTVRPVCPVTGRDESSVRVWYGLSTDPPTV